MKEATKAFRGIMPPLPTIVDAQGNFDASATATVLENLIIAGVDGVLILGSAGEFFSMNTAQRKEVTEFCLKIVAGRIVTLVGTGACSTRETLDLSCHAASCGADAVMIINPYYSPMSEECLYEHYTSIADQVEVPVFLYNFPAMTGQDLSVDLIGRLAAHANIKGLKDSVTDVGHTRRVLLEVSPKRKDFAVFSGFDEHVLTNLTLGGAGGIPGTANFAPHIMCGLYKAFTQKDWPTVLDLHCQVSGISPVYAVETPYFGTLKEAIRLCRMPELSTAVLPPSRPLSTSGLAKLEALLRGGKLIR